MFYKGEKNNGNLENTVVAKLKKNGHDFEILVYPFIAWDYRHSHPGITIEQVIAYDEIYSDVAKANLASKELLLECFNTDDIRIISDKIIKDGEVQLTTTQKQLLTEKREKEIIDYIAKNAHDPRAKTPIPPQRLVNAFEELKIKINLNTPKEKEIQDILDKLKRIMPISMDKIIIEVEVPALYTGKASAVIFKYEVAEQTWLGSGDLFCKIKIPAGTKQQLVSDLNNVTHGNIVIRVEGAQ